MNATPALPLPGGSSIADACRAKIAAMLAPYLSAERRPDFGSSLWAVLSMEERRFVCRLARIGRNAASVEWRDMPDDFRDAIVRAWRQLSALVERVELQVERRARR